MKVEILAGCLCFSFSHYNSTILTFVYFSRDNKVIPIDFIVALGYQKHRSYIGLGGIMKV